MSKKKGKIDRSINEDVSLEQLRRIFEEAGIRLTPQRLEIFREISAAKDHPSAEILFERLKRRMPTISLDTIYRTLNTFENMGLIRKVHLLYDHARFDPDTSTHHHFLCIKCKKIIDFDWPDFDAFRLPENAGKFGRVLDQQVELRGICRECLEKNKEDRGK